MISTATIQPDLEVRSRDVWSYISPSRLNLWLKCPLAFKLKYIDGLEPPTTPSLFLGKQVHAGLEIWYRYRQFGRTLAAQDLIPLALRGWAGAVESSGVQFDSSAEEQQLQQTAVRLFETYLSQVGTSEARPQSVEISLEGPLIDPETGEDLGLPLVGIVDLILDEAAGPLICDFKTAAKSTAPEEIAHEIQLSCYSYLYRRLTGRREQALEIRSLVKTKSPQIVFHRYASREALHFRRLFAVLRDYLDALHAGRFTYRPSWTCSTCDYCHTHCRAWSG